MDRVENWDLSTYPLRERNGDIQTSFFKMNYKTYDGNTDFLKWHWNGKDDTGKQVAPETDVPYGVKISNVTRPPIEKPPGVKETDSEWYGMLSRIPSVDLIRNERKMGGKPTEVLAGLWYELVDGEWVADDKVKIRIPRFWADVTERYYEWREEAYKTANDPYKGQKRPYTRIQEMEKDLKERSEALAKKEMNSNDMAQTLQAQLKEAREKLKKAGVE